MFEDTKFQGFHRLLQNFKNIYPQNCLLLVHHQKYSHKMFCRQSLKFYILEISYPTAWYNQHMFQQDNQLCYRKPISSLAFSHDGKYLAVGDCGHNPSVRIWDITSSNEEHVVELTGHNYGISCIVSIILFTMIFISIYSYNLKYL